MNGEIIVYVDPDDDLVHVTRPGTDGVTLTLDEADALAARLANIVATWRRGQIAQTRHDMAIRHVRRRLVGRAPLGLRPRGQS